LRRSLKQTGLTLIEVVIVLLIIGLVTALVSVNLGTFSYWKEQGFIRRLRETLEFLHHQAVVDQSFYRIEFDLERNTYRIGVVRPEDDPNSTELAQTTAGSGLLTLELAAFLNPSPGGITTMIPPPSFPSMAQPVQLPADVIFDDIVSMRGKDLPSDGVTPYVLFSPRGFSEFGVIHMKLSNGAQVTLLINPFTGLVETHNGYKEFQWTYGNDKNSKT